MFIRVQSLPMTCIDIHTHAFPDHVAPRAMEKLSAKADWRAVGDGSIAGLLRSMDAAGIHRSAVCAIATKPGQVEGITKWLSTLVRQHGDRIIPFSSLHPKDDDPVGWVRRIAEAQMRGIKLHPMYQDFVVDSPSLMPIYETAAEYHLPVALHCGSDIGFKNNPIPDRAAPKRLAGLADALPQLRLLCTHMGGWSMWDEVEEHLLGKNVFLETSFTSAFLPPERLADMIRKHGSEKVCFGTDWPWNDQAAERAIFAGLGFSEDDVQNIEYRSALRLLGEKNEG
ncbi:MAG: amidohydrolase family protein [Phycisphaerae bacterium]|nr:amidohydrolase family protein [Phycisphaerae bacterium]